MPRNLFRQILRKVTAGARFLNTCNSFTPPKARLPRRSLARLDSKPPNLFPTMNLKVLTACITKLKTSFWGLSNHWKRNAKPATGTTHCHSKIHHPSIHQSKNPFILPFDELSCRNPRRPGHLLGRATREQDAFGADHAWHRHRHSYRHTHGRGHQWLESGVHPKCFLAGCECVLRVALQMVQQFLRRLVEHAPAPANHASRCGKCRPAVDPCPSRRARGG